MPLTYDRFAKVPILCDENPALASSDREDVRVRSSRMPRRDLDDVKSSGGQPGDDEMRDVLVGQKTYHSAATTVSCWR